MQACCSKSIHRVAARDTQRGRERERESARGTHEGSVSLGVMVWGLIGVQGVGFLGRRIEHGMTVDIQIPA